MRLSIRWRLTLWNTLGLALMLLAFAALVYGLLRHALYEQVDQKLLGALGQLQQDERAAAAPDERLRYWIYEWREHENFAAIVYDAGILELVRGDSERARYWLTIAVALDPDDADYRRILGELPPDKPKQ